MWPNPFFLFPNLKSAQNLNPIFTFSPLQTYWPPKPRAASQTDKDRPSQEEKLEGRESIEREERRKKMALVLTTPLQKAPAQTSKQPPLSTQFSPALNNKVSNKYTPNPLSLSFSLNKTIIKKKNNQVWNKTLRF